MKNFFLYIFFSIAFILLEDNLLANQLSLLENSKSDQLLLKLEPFNITTFIVDKYYPNSFVDFDIGSCKIDGSMRLPIYQNIPEKLYFDRNNEGTYTQLSYKQKKSDLFFDTNIAFKTDLNEFSNIVLKAESKSIYSNVNQNYHLSYNKNDNNNVFIFDYMYHVEKNPSIEFFEDLNFNIESFHGGYSYSHNGNNFIFNSNSSIQFSNNFRYQGDFYQYDYQSTWADNDIIIPIRNFFSISFLHSYKKYLIEYSDNLNYYNSNNSRQMISFNINYLPRDNFEIQLGYDAFMKKGSGNIRLRYNAKNFIFSLNTKNTIVDQLIITGNPNIIYRFIRNSFFDLSFFKHKSFSTSISYGQIYSDSFFDTFNENYYYYYHLNANINTSKFGGKISYYNYLENNFLSIKDFSTYELTYSPIIDNKRFRPFGKVFGNHYSFNKYRELNLNSILLYDDVNSTNNFIETIDTFNFEFGFIFDSFKISYIKLNPNIESLNMSNKIKFISYDYINLVWIFKD